jgi:arsenite methyltransferase
LLCAYLEVVVASLSIAGILRNEATLRAVGRRPEPDLVMADPESVGDYVDAGRESGVMAPTYLLHTAHVCDLVRPGDVVLDLACGPAAQLVQVARIRRDASFIGVDLSREMLGRAREHIEASGAGNVTVREADITSLEGLGRRSVNVVMSSMSLHHLPTVGHLAQTMREIARVLADDGAVYLGDFGRLRSERTMDIFASQYAGRQGPAFTADYANSLRAAFSVREFRQAMGPIATRARLYRMLPIPFLVAIRSTRAGAAPADAAGQLERIRRGFNPDQERDLRAMLRCFRLGGLATPLLG